MSPEFGFGKAAKAVASVTSKTGAEPFGSCLVFCCTHAWRLSLIKVCSLMFLTVANLVSANLVAVSIPAARSLARCSRRIPATDNKSSCSSTWGSQTTQRPQAAYVSSFQAMGFPSLSLFARLAAMIASISSRRFR